MIDVIQETAAPGRTITVTGRDWRATCTDQLGPGTTPPPKDAPDSPRLLFRQNGRTVDVGRAATDPDTYKFVVKVRVPTWARPGDATIIGWGRPGHVSEPAPFTVVNELPLTGRAALPGAALTGLSLVVLGTVGLAAASRDYRRT